MGGEPMPLRHKGTLRRPRDVALIGWLHLGDALGRLVLIPLKLGQGGLFFGGIWVSDEVTRMALHAALAAYALIAGLGLLRLRAYGYWLAVALVAVSAATTPIWWIWGRHLVAVDGSAPPGPLWLVVRSAWTLVLACWCVWRSRMFVRGRR